MSEKAIPVKAKNHGKNQTSHIVQQWNNRLALHNLRLVERYVNQELRLWLKFRMGNGVEFLAYLQWDGSRRFTNNVSQVGDLDSWMAIPKDFLHRGSLSWRHALAAMRSTNSKQKTVLVDTVKFMEFPEQKVPTFVWLESVNRVRGLWPHTLYFSAEVGRCVFLHTPSYWETGSCLDHATSDRNEMTGQMVKRAPHVLQGIPDYDWEVDGNLGYADTIITALSGVMVILKSDELTSCVGWPNEVTQGGFQLLDVLFGPFGFSG